ncbi:hypothetical protein PFLUV_G00209010 [Perca fluviatilis]|uniref:Uncharacterized protein n=1 Tax=Perca fluviatilis TaxID=8168 RepID=A0A6A5DSH8_PERFL|nr:hypothetical protein PFLUV_G00209010 [Perca fluviatilis]
MVFMEFSKNLKQEFYESIDRHSPCLLELFRSKRDYRANCHPDTGAQRASYHPWGQTHKLLQIKAGFESDDEDFFVILTLGYFSLSVKVLGSHLLSISVLPC